MGPSFFLRMICIRQGIPLWTASYPVQEDDSILISGFLLAIDSFFSTDQGSKTTLSSVKTGDKHWSFSKIHDQDGFFLVFQYPDLAVKELEREQEFLAQNLVADIKTDFEYHFSLDYFNNFTGSVNEYHEIKSRVNGLLEQFHGYISRFEFRDNVWLSKFISAEKLFTAAILGKSIIIIVNSIDPLDFLIEKSLINKTVATLEGLYYSLTPIMLITNTEQINSTDFTKKRIYIFTETVFASLDTTKISNETAIIKLGKETILNGPSPIPLAEKMVYDLRQFSHSNIENVLRQVHKTKENIAEILGKSITGTLNEADLRAKLVKLELPVRDTVILSLKAASPQINEILEVLCEKEKWDLTRFLSRANGMQKAQIEAICPRCGNKMEVSPQSTLPSNENIFEVLIDEKVSNYCGHEFIVYLDKNNQIQGYSDIRNLNKDNDIKDLFSKL